MELKACIAWTHHGLSLTKYSHIEHIYVIKARYTPNCVLCCWTKLPLAPCCAWGATQRRSCRPPLSTGQRSYTSCCVLTEWRIDLASFGPSCRSESVAKHWNIIVEWQQILNYWLLRPPVQSNQNGQFHRNSRYSWKFHNLYIAGKNIIISLQAQSFVYKCTLG